MNRTVRPNPRVQRTRSSPSARHSHSVSERRYFALGQADSGRRLFISFTIRKSLIRVVSARDMTRRELQTYEQSKA